VTCDLSSLVSRNASRFQFAPRLADQVAGQVLDVKQESYLIAELGSDGG
jgi:exosome complex RNA-binding protein Rrp4